MSYMDWAAGTVLLVRVVVLAAVVAASACRMVCAIGLAKEVTGPS